MKVMNPCRIFIYFSISMQRNAVARGVFNFVLLSFPVVFGCAVEQNHSKIHTYLYVYVHACNMELYVNFGMTHFQLQRRATNLYLLHQLYDYTAATPTVCYMLAIAMHVNQQKNTKKERTSE